MQFKNSQKVAPKVWIPKKYNGEGVPSKILLNLNDDYLNFQCRNLWQFSYRIYEDISITSHSRLCIIPRVK